VSGSQDSAPYAWKTVRVFICSAPRDFHAERDYLAKYVFPELREWCEQWRVYLVDIDLRWGMTREERAHGRTIEICLEEVDGSRPFFVGLLGNRYGWVPGPDLLPDRGAGAYAWFRGREDQSITHLEIQHAVLDPVRSVDTVEQVPHAFFYLRDETSLPDAETLTALSPAERNEYRDMFFEQDTDRRGRLRDLKAQIRRHYEELGAARGNAAEVAARLFAYSPEFDPGLTNPEDDKLKGRFTHESLREFGARVKEDIKKSIAQQFQGCIAFLARKREEDPLTTERKLHESFAETHTRSFVGREALLKRLREYVIGDSREVLAVYGEEGSGKSALLAEFYRSMKDFPSGAERPNGGTEPAAHIIPHFVGASPGATAPLSVLQVLCRDIYEHCGLRQRKREKLAAVKGKYARATARRLRIEAEYRLPGPDIWTSSAFRAFLQKCRGRVLIVLDGADRLDERDSGQVLAWLPLELPAHVKIIVSSSGGISKVALARKTHNELTVTALSLKDRRELVRRALAVFCKRLAREQVEVLVRKEEAGNPLYLSVALEQLRLYGGSGQALDQCIKELGTHTEDLFGKVLARLECDLAEGTSARAGAAIAERVFCLLACARHGLTRRELRVLMAESDPDGRHALALCAVRDHLHRCGDVISLYHLALYAAVKERFLGADRAKQWHAEWGEYWGRQPAYIGWRDGRAPDIGVVHGHGPERRPNLRKLDEQFPQQYRAEQWDAIAQAFTDFSFLEAYAETGRMRDLISDLNAAVQVVEVGSEDRPMHGLLVLLCEALARDYRFVMLHPETLFQCLWNSCWWYDCPAAAAHYECSERDLKRLPWNRPGPKLFELLESWRAAKESDSPGFPWVRSLRPPPVPLGGAGWYRLKAGTDAEGSAKFLADGTLVGPDLKVWDTCTGRAGRMWEGQGKAARFESAHRAGRATSEIIFESTGLRGYGTGARSITTGRTVGVFPVALQRLVSSPVAPVCAGEGRTPEHFYILRLEGVVSGGRRVERAAYLPCDRRKVLIADHEQMLCALFKTALVCEFSDLAVDLASSGGETIEAFCRAHHAVLVLAESLGHRDGALAYRMFLHLQQICARKRWEMPCVLVHGDIGRNAAMRSVTQASNGKHGMLQYPCPADRMATAVGERLARPVDPEPR